MSNQLIYKETGSTYGAREAGTFLAEIRAALAARFGLTLEGASFYLKKIRKKQPVKTKQLEVFAGDNYLSSINLRVYDKDLAAEIRDIDIPSLLAKYRKQLQEDSS